MKDRKKHQGGKVMIKKSVLSILIIIFSLSTLWSTIGLGQTLSQSKLEASPLSLQFNVNEEVVRDETGLIHRNVLYVPLQFILEAMGKEMVWDDRNHTIYISNAQEISTNTRNTREASLPALQQNNGEMIQVEQIPIRFNVHGVEVHGSRQVGYYEIGNVSVPLALYYKDTVYAPVQFIAEALEQEVSWNKKENLITMTSIQPATDKDKKQNLQVYVDFYQYENLRQINLDAQQSYGDHSLLILNQVMEGLMRLDEDGKPIPGMAKEVKLSDDGLVYTFTLREANWSDGSKVQAEDFKYGWLRAIRLSSPYSFLLDTIVGVKNYRYEQAALGSVAIKATGERTLQVTLKHPDPGFLSLVTNPVFFPAKKSFVEKKGGNYGYNESNLLYNGPFVLQFVSSNSIYLQKNESYWNRDNIHLEQLSLAYKDSDQDDEKANHLTYDMVIPHPTDWNEKLADGKQLLSVQGANIYYAFLNNESTLFSNKNLRQAVAHLIDQKQVAQLPHMVPANGLISKGISGLRGLYHMENEVSLLNYDLEKAKRLVAEGKKELGVSVLPVVQFVVSASIGEQPQIDAMVRLLEEGGFDVELIFVDPLEWFETYEEGNYDLGVMGWNFDYDNPLNLLETFKSSNAQNYLHYNNATYDSTIERAKREQDLEKRFELIQSAEEQLIEDAVIVPLYSFKLDYLKRDYVKGVNYHTYGSPLDFSQVYILGRQD
jgi:oligopeptide transport system substrate-binding protein